MKFIKVSFSSEETLAVDATVQALVFHYKACHWSCPEEPIYILQTSDTVEEVMEKISLDDRDAFDGLDSLNLQASRILEADNSVPLDAKIWMKGRARSKAELLEFLKSSGLMIQAR